MERGLEPREEAEDLGSKRRRDSVADKVLCAKLADRYLRMGGQRVTRIDDKCDFVVVDGDGRKLVLLRKEGEDAELNGAVEDLLRDAASQGALHDDLDLRTAFRVLGEHRQQEVRGVLIGSDEKAAALERAELRYGCGGFTAEAQEPFGIAAEHFAGGSKRAIAGTLLKEPLAQLVFQPTDGLTNGGLGAMEARSGSGEAVLLSDG